MAESSKDVPHNVSPSSDPGLDPAYYTWANMFKIMLGTASEDVAFKYANYRSLLREEKDCAKCEKYVKHLFQYSTCSLAKGVSSRHG